LGDDAANALKQYTDTIFPGNRVNLFITGISGLLGLNIAHLARDKFQVSGCYSGSDVCIDGVETLKLDITDLTSTAKAVRARKPHLIIHTAARTSVDYCETNPKEAETINTVASRNLASIAENLGSKFVHISTDQLFDGASSWKTEEDSPTPLNVYGDTKWRGEQQVAKECPSALILRTNFYGWGTSKRTSFSDWILHGLQQKQDLTMFSDVFYTPILINHMAAILFSLVEAGASGLFHLVGSERLSKHDFALRLATIFGYTDEYMRRGSVMRVPLNARRPLDMSLSSAKVESYLKVQMPNVEEGLKMLKKLQEDGWPEALEKAHTNRKLD
jgi:dTDP-4-dehydrorhamnose reductase